jgi:exoribonuclease R
MPSLKTKDYKNFTIDEENVPLSKIIRGLPDDEMKINALGEWHVQERSPTHTLPIVGTLILNSKYKYGLTSRGVPLYLFTPYNESYPCFIVGSSERDTSKNRLVLVQFDSWPENSKFPRANLQRILGISGDFKAEAEALYWLYSPQTLNLKNLVMPTTEGASQDHRKDISHLPTISIDPPGCKDIDDVISYKQIGSLYTIIITIADVAETIDEGTPIDIHARKVGQTLYSGFLPPRNMLPSALSEDTLSLLPNQKRFGVSLFIQWDSENKEILTSVFHQTIVMNKTAHTYESVYKDTEFPINILQDISDSLGSIDIKDSHTWIERLMVYYNAKASNTLAMFGCGIFRGQQEATLPLLDKYMRICPHLAHEAAIFTDAENIIPHYSLGIDSYCYASSPIRRYVDIVNQRLLKKIIETRYGLLAEPPSLIDEMTELQKQAKRHSRDEFFLQQLAAAATTATPPELDGILFECEKSKKAADSWKLKVYIPQWRRFVKLSYEGYKTERDTYVFQKKNNTDTFEIKEEDPIRLTYYYNPNKVGWKRKFVFQPI